MKLLFLTLAGLLVQCHASVSVPALSDIRKEWTTVVSKGHLVEAFSHLGQLHILDPTPKESYLINLFEYRASLGTETEKLELRMQFVGQLGSLKWFKDGATWKIVFNDCSKDFDVAPQAISGTSALHWIVLVTDTKFFLKCNGVVVATAENSGCSYKTWGGASAWNNLGGWELVRMNGMKTRFESLKEVGECAFPSYKYQARGLIGVKKLITAMDCYYDCKHTTNCVKATINIGENACNLYSDYGGRPLYNKEVSSEYENRYLNYLFGTYVSFQKDCFTKKDDVCWRRDARYNLPTLGKNPKSMVTCFSTEHSTENTVMWDPINGKCSVVSDENSKVAETAAPGFITAHKSCQTTRDSVVFDQCKEVGVVLNGQVIKETDFKLPTDCEDLCKLEASCSGWSAITSIKKCYLYTGRVYKQEFPRAISGAYNCNEDLALVPVDRTTLVNPVGTAFDLLTTDKPGILNLMLEMNQKRRSLEIFSESTYKFSIDFFPEMQNSDWDIRIGGCSSQFNYTSEPCGSTSRKRNYYQINLTSTGGEIQLDILCGHQIGGVALFFSKTDLVADCGMSITSWDGVRFKDFDATDQWNAGFTAKLPAETIPAADIPVTWGPLPL